MAFIAELSMQCLQQNDGYNLQKIKSENTGKSTAVVINIKRQHRCTVNTTE